MGAMASQITSLTIVYSTVYSDADEKISKLCVTGIYAGNDDVIMVDELDQLFASQFFRVNMECWAWSYCVIVLLLLCCYW